jgi:hypothetical protein
MQCNGIRRILIKPASVLGLMNALAEELAQSKPEMAQC